MTSIKDFIDNIYFIFFKRYIFKSNHKKNDYFEDDDNNAINDIDDNDDNDDNNEEIVFLRELKI